MPAPRKNWLEWSVFAVGLALLLCTTGYLAYQAIMHRGEPAALAVVLGDPWTLGSNPGDTVVPITVHNNGGHTAAEVTVEIVLVRDRKADEPVERRELTFAFVPHHSSRSGALTFRQRPRREELEAHVLGYLEP